MSGRLSPRGLLIGSTIGMMVLSPASAVQAQVSQTLTTASEQFEGYYYAAYDFRVAGDAPLTILMQSSQFDSYLVLLQPDGSVLINDDYAGDLVAKGVDAGIRVEDPRSGNWSLLATTLGTGETGSFEITLEGGTELQPAIHIDAEDVKGMFAARGIESQEEIREQQVSELVDQLSLATFRADLQSRLLSEIRDREQTAATDRAQLNTLEKEERTLDEAKDDLALLPETSERILQALVDEKRASATAAADSATSMLIRSTTDQAAFRQALDELKELQAVAAELDRLHARLMEEVDIDELQDVRDRIRDAQSRFERLADTIARKLLDSGFIDQIQFGGFRILPLDRHLVGFAGVGGGGGGGGVLAGIVGGDPSAGWLPSRRIDPSVWLPQLLPWPPPDASATLVLRRELLRHPGGEMPATLGELADVLQASLQDAGYDGGGYLGVPTGFAIVTRLEQTDELGEPLDGPQRWLTTIVGLRGFSLSEYVRVLLTAPAGHYRVLAFVVASDPFFSSGSRDRLEAVQVWSRKSVSSLPEQVREYKLHDGYEVTVLVYEFLKRQESDRPETTVPGHLTARDHLVRTGLDAWVGEG